MIVEELIKQLEQLPKESEVLIRYGKENQVSDVCAELVCDDEGIGDFYLICSSGTNIRRIETLDN